MSKELIQIRSFLLQQKAAAKGQEKSLLQRRAEANEVMLRTCAAPEGTLLEETSVGGVPGLWVRAAGISGGGKVILYFHGGGFFSGSSRTHSGLAAALSQAAGCSVLLPDYRLAPEHPYPAAHEDCLAVYIALLRAGIAPGDIILGGDSAGGMLALATMLTLRDHNAALPGAAFLLSPWLELVDFSGESYRVNAELDPMCDLEQSKLDAAAYFGDEEQCREINPLSQGMACLPPLLIQVGEQEILLSDAQRLAALAKDAGVEVTLEVWPECWHIFQALTAMLPEAREAVARVGEFIRNHSA